ncbi:histidine--tRNA ligase [Streptobacillus felis]|uniref:Histidine--tRNA ligase n=1 Tax=Streptobacillus felis TaxID=1384509 RepID=A0A7Z0T7H6_9FUSO|nr:histidine--tRNA ligase [Streptobacillus felis]NYV28296.1 histidine--tRNA ligase [Streptobacillus felis]
MKFETLRGMKDMFSIDVDKYNFIVNTAKKTFDKYGYSNIITPILEETDLFKRAVGDETDVVSKEMYTFMDKGDRSVTMRPEGTAGVVRAYLNAGFHKSSPNVKWYYYGPMYRYEAPQKGRYREFHQFGVESFGIRSPFLDAELITMACEFLNQLGINDLVVELNSLGSVESRIVYIKELQNYLLSNIDKLSNDSKIRAEKNPLRVFDSKDEGDQKVLESAPKLHDFFDEESTKYFEELKSTLYKFNVKYVINPALVRGLDYYCDTVFEIKSSKLGSQSTVLGGGRYDKLTEILGGVKVPGIGFAAGIERLSMIMDESLLEKNDKKIYIAYFEETKDYLLEVLKELRKHDLNVEFEYSLKGFSAQMKKANKIGVNYVIILGENEIKNGKVTFKDFNTGNQEEISITEVIERVK